MINPKIYLSLIITFTPFIYANENISLLNNLQDNDGWALLDKRLDSIRVYEKKIDNMQLKALKVEKIIDFDYEYILNTVIDVDGYSEALDNSDLTSFIVGEKDGFIYAYNHVSVPFPFIDDRHYFFKIKKISDYEINWTLVPEFEANSIFKFKRIMDKKSGSVYIDYGAGIWKVEPLTENLSNVSYSLYMDSGGLITDYLNDLFASQSIINLYKAVLSSGSKKAK